MILIIGGIGCGKLKYAQSTYGFCDEQIADGVMDERPVLNNLQDLVRKDVRIDLEKLSKKELIICNEVGSGIVPLRKGEREYRENVGRLCCDIASRAKVVIRVVCGVAQKIKGE